MAAMAANTRQPCWLCPLGGGYAFWASREYTPAEQEYSTYTALIHGTTGFLYFASHPRSPSLWAKLKQLSQEVGALTPALATGVPVPGVECSSSAVQYRALRLGDRLLLIAVNGSPGPAVARFNLGTLAAADQSAEVQFEDRTVAMEGSLLQDSFAGYQRHVYTVTLMP